MELYLSLHKIETIFSFLFLREINFEMYFHILLQLFQAFRPLPITIKIWGKCIIIEELKS